MSITTTPQAAKAYAIIDNPPTVFACRVNQAFTSTDKVTAVNFDTVSSGSYANVLPGMTVLVGSSPAAWDMGITYARKAPTSSTLYVGEISEIKWADNLYLTVLQEFGIWNEYPVVDAAGHIWLNYNVAYTNQNSVMKPVPILGPDRVVWLDGASVNVAFDASFSYVPGSTIASHAFSCSGGTITGAATATPTLTFTAAGRYLLTYTVTSAAGASNTTYRVIWVINQTTVTNIVAGRISGSFDTGGWQFELQSTNANLTFRERTKVILLAEEWYGGTKTSYGPISGAENIVAIGWLDNEDIKSDMQKGTVSLSAKGAWYWLQQIYNYGTYGIKSVSGTPATWLEFNSLTIDKALWQFFVWRSTLCNCADVFLPGDTRTASEFSAEPGTLWDQIKAIPWKRIFAAPCCDRYSRVFVQVPGELLPNSGRGAIPTNATLTHDDWSNVEISRSIVPTTAQVVLSGVSLVGSKYQTYYSLAPGHIPQHYGQVQTYEKLLLSSQAQANELAGALLERDNATLVFQINDLLWNNRLVDLCPRQYVNMTMSADDNLRNVAYSGNVIVDSIDLELRNGAWLINWKAKEETFSKLAINGDVPRDNPGDKTPKTSPVPISPLPTPIAPYPGMPPDPQPDMPDPAGCPDSAPATGPFMVVWDKFFLDGTGTDAQRSAKAWLPCVIRSATAANLTVLDLGNMNYRGQPWASLHCYAIDAAGARILTGTLTYTVYTDYLSASVAFSPVSATTVAGFELYLDPGLDTDGVGFSALRANSFFKNSYYGHAYTLDTYQTINDLAGGKIGYRATFYGNGDWLSGLTVQHLTQLSIPTGATGTLYASINGYITTGGAPAKYDLGINMDPLVDIQYSSIYGLYILQKYNSWVPGRQPDCYVDVTLEVPYPGGGCDIHANFDIWYLLSASIPARSISYYCANLYNVCGVS